MSKETEKRIVEWTYWFEEHKNDGGDVRNKIKFLTKAIDGCYELLIRALQDIQKLEGRKAREAKNLILSPKYRTERPF